ncbi:MAG: hypothetical protein KQ78_02230 [Candidatus Izimaplasma bacterium HR2]|nr:MAG: hypothetical protein KQ78_02230 [Candidatus Izimaplasma bacterium HR2]
MKKTKTIIAFLLLAINIWMQYYNPLNYIILIIKHMSLFLLVALVAYEVTTVLSKRLIRNYSPTGVKEIMVYVGRVLSFGLIIMLFSTFQYNYIQFNEVTTTEGCKYYDQYNNLIYKSRFYESCPELEILENTDVALSFNVNEYFIIKNENITYSDITYEHANLEMRVFTTIHIEYTSEQKIASVDFKSTYHNDTISDEFSGTGYVSFHQQISYSYINNFESTVKEARHIVEYDYLLTNTLEHYQFSEENYSTINYYLEDGYNSTNDIFYHLVKDYTDGEDILQTEEIASINFRVEDDVTSYTIVPLLPEIDKYYFRYGKNLLNRTIDIVYRENNISWLVNTELENYTNQIMSRYVSINGFKSLKSSSSIKTYNSDKLQTNHIYKFELLTLASSAYLSQELESSVKIGTDYLDSHYRINKTEYGYSVEYLVFRDQHYINYLIYGESEHSMIYKIYFDEVNYIFTGYNEYEKLFDIEFQLLELKVGDNIFYRDAPYLIYD